MAMVITVSGTGTVTVTSDDDPSADLMQRLTHLENLIMTTKDEVLAQLADLKALVTETQEDVARVIAKLDLAVANNDLTAVSDAIGELRTAVQGIDDAAETADPEPEPTPEV